MPWSPFPHIKEVARQLREKGYEKQVDTPTLRKELKKQTRSTRDTTISSYMKLMEEFNMMKPAEDKDGRNIPGIWILQDEAEWEI